MQSDDGKMMKFMISFGALQKLVSEEVGQPGQARPGHLQTLRLQLLTSSLRPLYLVATFVFVPNGERLGAETTTFVASEGRAAMKVLDSQYL